MSNQMNVHSNLKVAIVMCVNGVLLQKAGNAYS
jgi:hypothetical protein